MDLGAVRTQLDELGVDAPSLRTVIVEDAPDVVLAFDVDPSTWFDTWQQLRKGVGALAMWPLATWELYGPPEKISRFETQGPDGLDASPRAIISRVPDVDVDQLLDAEQAAQHEQTESWADYESHLASTVTRAAIDGVDITLLHRELGPSPDHVDVERWPLDIELKCGLDPDPNHRDGYLNWFVPPEAAMLLLPTTLPWAAGAYVAGFEWGYPHTDLRTALLRRWHQRYGAEMAANWGTMQQLVVHQPPATIEQAWTAAYEIDLLWADTVTGPCVPIRRHAQDLVGRRDWFLHNRP